MIQRNLDLLKNVKICELIHLISPRKIYSPYKFFTYSNKYKAKDCSVILENFVLKFLPYILY